MLLKIILENFLNKICVCVCAELLDTPISKAEERCLALRAFRLLHIVNHNHGNVSDASGDFELCLGCWQIYLLSINNRSVALSVSIIYIERFHISHAVNLCDHI